MSNTIRVQLATESLSNLDHHYVFSAECADRMAQEAVGMPVTINFEGDPVGTVVRSLRTPTGIDLDIEVEDNVAQRIASPAFAAWENDWNDDFTERVIRDADLKGISFTDV